MKRLSCIALLLFALPHPALAWENKTAHPAINKRALDYFTTHYYQDQKAKYERAALELETSCQGPAVTVPGNFDITTENQTKTLSEWIQHGGFSADEPEVIQSLRHFYDPIPLDKNYLTDIVGDSMLTNPAIDARTWALDGPSSGTYPANQFAWKQGLSYYRQALESTENRGENLAKAFRALGETMHLLADMTQPAHVRNDGHPFGDPIESGVTGTKVNAVNVEVPVDVSLNATNPDLLFHNVAGYTNQNFYSEDTITDIENKIYPNGDPLVKGYANPKFKDFTYKDGIVYRGDRKIMEQGLLGYLMGSNAPRPFHVPKAYADDYAAMLIPLAVQANAKLIDLFLPNLNLTLQVNNGTATAKLEHTLDSVWTSAIKYAGDGALYKKTSGEPALVANVTFANGEMTRTIYGLQAGDTAYLEVKAGGRVIRSPEVTIQASPPESAWSTLKTCTNVRLQLYGHLDYSNTGGDPFDYTYNNTQIYSIFCNNLQFNEDRSFTGHLSEVFNIFGKLSTETTVSGTFSEDGRTLKTFRISKTETSSNESDTVTDQDSRTFAINEFPLTSGSQNKYEYYLSQGVGSHMAEFSDVHEFYGPFARTVTANSPDYSQILISVTFSD